MDNQRAALRQRTEDEISRIHAEYWRTAGQHRDWAVGTAYARYSTRFQESIGDQIRSLLEFALANRIRVPRELIFFDLAVRGAKNRRTGLDELRHALKSRKASVLLLFATNRLFRKTYRTLEFVDSVHQQLRARCIFVKSGVDTDDRDRWEGLLHLAAIMDQFVVRMGIAHIHAAHEGMLIKQLVFGTISFGYCGRPIPGELTRKNKPRCEIAVDDRAAEVVRSIFQWYVHDRLEIIDILRRLNADPAVPLPPKTTVGRWTRLAVRSVLQNTRYRGLWRYGVCESVFLPDDDYVCQRPRAAPLKEVQLDELRIVDDALWFAAAERIARDKQGRGGRSPKDGDSTARPKLLNGLLVCPQHDDQRLYVGGPFGRVMVCPICRAMPAADRPLYTMLNRQLATELLITQIIGLIHADAELDQQIVNVCEQAAVAAQCPDPTAIKHLQQELIACMRTIDLTRRTAGSTAEDQQQAETTIRDLQGEAAGLRSELARLQLQQQQLPRVPTCGEVQALRNRMASRLLAAFESNDIEVIAQARRILELVTGGRIALEQQGLREPKRGWLRARYRCQLISALSAESSGAAHLSNADGEIEMILDFRRPSEFDLKAENARVFKVDGRTNREIMAELGCSRSMVTKLLKHAAFLRGETYIDGRTLRHQRSPRSKLANE
ncbi:recombinase family protein [Anatilimnocola aggregata]|uniref:recombinase family protein n=1 Tax=Anatilimnocola aggregata TaxID=2528021 RepID=UPI00192E3AA7|nr:recombinase family protein [Anatilimnocola aggregata]